MSKNQLREHLDALAKCLGYRVVTDAEHKKLEQIVGPDPEPYMAGNPGGTKSLKHRYGEGKTKTIINRAIREELAGGSEILDLREQVHLAGDSIAGKEMATKLNTVIFEMDNEIRRRYGMNEIT